MGGPGYCGRGEPSWGVPHCPEDGERGVKRGGGCVPAPCRGVGSWVQLRQGHPRARSWCHLDPAPVPAASAQPRSQGPEPGGSWPPPRLRPPPPPGSSTCCGTSAAHSELLLTLTRLPRLPKDSSRMPHGSQDGSTAGFPARPRATSHGPRATSHGLRAASHGLRAEPTGGGQGGLHSGGGGWKWGARGLPGTPRVLQSPEPRERLLQALLERPFPVTASLGSGAGGWSGAGRN